MASFYDKGDVGPDTDPDPTQGDGPMDNLHVLDNIQDNLVDDEMNQREPGLGGEFNGDDPSIWHTTGQAEEPTAWTDSTPPVLSIEAQELYDQLIAAAAIEEIDDTTILTFAESISELEAIFAEFDNADQADPPVGDPFAETEAGVIAAAVVDAVQEQVIDTTGNVSETANEDLLYLLDDEAAAEVASKIVALPDEDEPWWQDPRDLKEFLGVNWSVKSGLSISNPAWMSPAITWDDNQPWWLQFDTVLPPSNYVWFSGDFGHSLADRLGYEDQEEADTELVLTTETDLQDFGDVIASIDNETDLIEFSTIGIDYTSIGTWDDEELL